jgi:hypothetical protein
MVLGDGREPLVQQILEAIMIGLDEEAAPPQIQPPVPHSMDEPDELPLIGGECAMTGCNGSAEERDRVVVLNQHGPEPLRRGVTLDGELLGEVRHGEDRGRGDRGFEMLNASDAAAVHEMSSFLRRAVSGAAMVP